MKQIGFIGLGHIGNPLVHNLLKASFDVHIYDVNPQMQDALIASGAKIAKDVKTLAQNAEIIFTSVQTGDQVKNICLGKDGIFENAKANTLFIDCSSIDIETTRLLHQEAQKNKIAMLDAPVSGGVTGARNATLTFMVGGDEKNFSRAESILKILGKKIIHAGNAGAGQAAKICNNLLLGISMIGVAEAFTLAKNLGLDQKKFFEISSNASGQCWSMTSYCPVPNIIENVPANQNYQPGFMAKMMLKDLRLAMHAAELTESTTPLGGLATELYQLFVGDGFGELDFSAIINLINNYKND